MRTCLPNRRRSVLFKVQHCGVTYTATISYLDGHLREIFLDHPRPNSDLAEHANDAAVLASLLLQHGVDPKEILHSISGPLATALAEAEAQSGSVSTLTVAGRRNG